MRARALAAVACAALAVLVGGCSGGGGGAGTPVSQTPSAVVVGETVFAAGQRPAFPTLSGTTIKGGTLDLATLRGKVLVLNVWASWCDPCREESPDLAKVAKAYGSRGVVFVGLDEQDINSHAVAFSEQAGTTYEHLVDPDGSMLLSLKVVPPAAIPSTLVVDRQGQVAVRFIGRVTAAALSHALAGVLSGA